MILHPLLLLFVMTAHGQSSVSKETESETSSTAESASDNSPINEAQATLGVSLCVAANAGNIDEVRRLLVQGADPKWDHCDFGCGGSPSSYATTPLLCAAAVGHADIVEVLLEAGADADTPGYVAAFKDFWGDESLNCSPLAVAVKSPLDNTDAIKELLAAGAEANPSCNRRTAAEWAKKRKHVGIVTMLQQAAPADERKAAFEKHMSAKLAELTVEADGDIQTSKYSEAVNLYSELLRKYRWNPFFRQSLSEKVLRTAASMSTRPEVPEEAERRVARGKLLLKKAASEDDFAAVAHELEQAVDAAPWIASTYYNLALVQAKAGLFNDAIRNMKLYLIGSPHAADAASVKNKIYEWELDAEKVK